jgi:endogenous inhibitor of DNA gyrase (YacG/DUF329 family)
MTKYRRLKIKDVPKTTNTALGIPSFGPEMNDIIDIECPNCGRTIRSNVEKCPHCHIQLKFLDIKDLEAVANEYGGEGKGGASSKGDESEKDDSEPKRFLGKLFGRGRK